MYKVQQVVVASCLMNFHSKVNNCSSPVHMTVAWKVFMKIVKLSKGDVILTVRTLITLKKYELIVVLHNRSVRANGVVSGTVLKILSEWFIHIREYVYRNPWSCYQLWSREHLRQEKIWRGTLL